MAKRLMGVDPGTQVVGWGVVDLDGRRPVFVACGAIRAKDRKAPVGERLASIADKLAELVREYEPDAAAVEKAFFGKSAASALRVGESRGVILAELARAGVPVEELAPREVKKAVTGTGSAEKRQVQLMITAILGLTKSPEPLDASDAVAMAITLAHRTTIPSPGPKRRSARVTRSSARRNSSQRG